MMIIHPSKHGSKLSDVVYKVVSSAVTAKQLARTECAESICYAERKMRYTHIHAFRSYQTEDDDINVM